jgi:UDP-glucose 4-epimerase
MTQATIYSRRILITGGAGHVGGSLARKLVTDPENYVVIVDNLSTGCRTNLPSEDYGNWAFYEADVNGIKWLLDTSKWEAFDYIFHYAAVVGVARTQQNPAAVMQDLEGIRNVLDLAVLHKVKRVFYASSSEVYGEPVEMPQHELTTPLNSRLPYAVVKNAGESYIQAYHKEYQLQYTVIRLFNTYGPRQSEDFVISRFLRKALNNEPIHIYGDGLQTRTYCHVADHVHCVELMVYEDYALNSVINIGSDIEITVLELAKMIIKQTGSSSMLVHKPPLPAGDMKRRCPDISFMRSFVRKPPISLEAGLEDLIREFRRAETGRSPQEVLAKDHTRANGQLPPTVYGGRGSLGV